jgi:hypothetical protein
MSVHDHVRESQQSRYKESEVVFILLFATDNMQAFPAASSANSQSYSPILAPALSTRTIQFVQGIQDNGEDLLSSESDLELSFASAMSLNSPLRGSMNLTDNADREDVIPMDISPEPSRLAQHSQGAGAHFIEKATRNCETTTSVRLFGRDLSNEAPMPSATSSCESGPAIAICVCVVSCKVQSLFTMLTLRFVVST